MPLYLNDKEKERTQMFIQEKKQEFEREQDTNELMAERKGETYIRQEFSPISEDDALAAVRAGWKSQLDLRFEKKGRKEGWISK